MHRKLIEMDLKQNKKVFFFIQFSFSLFHSPIHVNVKNGKHIDKTIIQHKTEYVA